MHYIDIVKLLMKIDDKLFDEMKIILLEKYISFSIIDNEKVTKELLCEKICDYIEKTIIKTRKSFEELLNYYMDSIAELVEGHLLKISLGKNSKGKEEYHDSRALKYFNQVQTKRNEKKQLFAGIEDYSRIIFCLYAEIIRKKRKPITDFEFSFETVRCQTIINAIESEEVKEQKLFKFKLPELKKRFNVFNKYSQDAFVVIMIIIMLYYLKNKEVKGGY